MTTEIELSAKLAEIGAQLRQMREKKDLTLEQVQASTLIPKAHLQAIEDGNFDRLPELVYVQGFIRKYGQAIGLVDLATELPTHQSETSPSYQPELRPWHLYAIYVTIVVVSVSILAVLFREPLPPPPSPALPNNQVAPNSPPSPPPLPASPPPVNVAIEMVGESWMRVTVDGNLDFEGIMPEGTVKQWSGEREIILRTGNAAAVQVQFNQTPAQVLGAEGEVIELVFDRNAATPIP